MGFIFRGLTFLLCVVVSSSVLADVCDDAWHSASNAPSSQLLWTRCENKVATSPTAKDFYILALYKKQKFPITHSEGLEDLLNNKENKRFRILEQEHYSKVISLLRDSAKKGFVKAQYELGEIFSDEAYGDNPIFAKKHLHKYYNPDRAFYWYGQAANRGNADAEEKVAKFYLDGTVVKLDIERAFSLLAKSAKQENSSAAYDLALHFTAVQSQNTDILGYAWFLYYKKLKSMGRYSTPQTLASLDDQFTLARRMRGRSKPISEREKRIANVLLKDLSRGRYNDMGIPITWQKLTGSRNGAK